MGAIGLHIERGYDQPRLFRCLDTWKPNDVILSNDGVDVRSGLRNRYPNLRIWLRFYPDDDTFLHTKPSTYIRKAVQPLTHQPYFLAADNEPPFSDEKVLWWRDVARAATNCGVRCALPGFPAGGPQTDTYEPDSLQLIPRARPLIEAIIAGNHVLRLNEYASIFWTSGWAWDERLGFKAPQATLSCPEDHDEIQTHCGRWKYWKKHYGNNLNILIGETGFDTIDSDPDLYEFVEWVNLYKRKKWGPRACLAFWRQSFGTHYSEDQLYGMQLILMAKHMYAESNVLGQCVYSYSDRMPNSHMSNVSHREELWDIIGDYNSTLGNSEDG